MISGRQDIEEAAIISFQCTWFCVFRDTIPTVSVFNAMCDGELDLGEFGYIYFIDWDQVRARKRVVDIQITGE